MVSEVKFMEIFKIEAVVVAHDDKHFIKIETEDGEIKIPISEDNPNEVKSAFNKIISVIKKKVFQIELNDVGQDLFSQVANEYVTQLNREIQEVRKEMEGYGLVND